MTYFKGSVTKLAQYLWTNFYFFIFYSWWPDWNLLRAGFGCYKIFLSEDGGQMRVHLSPFGVSHQIHIQLVPRVPFEQKIIRLKKRGAVLTMQRLIFVNLRY